AEIETVTLRRGVTRPGTTVKLGNLVVRRSDSPDQIAAEDAEQRDTVFIVAAPFGWRYIGRTNPLEFHVFEQAGGTLLGGTGEEVLQTPGTCFPDDLI